MKFQKTIDETARALAFLTILPMPDHFFAGHTEDRITHCAGFYPLAGIIIGMCSALILIISTLLFLPVTLAASLALIASIVMTGALHEDGLGDVADGFGGGATRQQRLEIMKDSRIGSYGVIALVASLVLRVLALAAIVDTYGLFSGCFALIAASAASRGAMVWMWSDLPNARSDGVSGKLGKPPENAVSMAAISGLAAALIFGILGSGFVSATIAIGLAVLALLGFQRLCLKMIGGQTGDTLGACQQLVEISMLTGLASIHTITI